MSAAPPVDEHREHWRPIRRSVPRRSVALMSLVCATHISGIRCYLGTGATTPFAVHAGADLEGVSTSFIDEENADRDQPVTASLPAAQRLRRL